MKKIVLTGGGTAGHVTPNLALVKNLLKEDYKISYIGSKNGIEKELVLDEGLEYHSISTGKLRRYLDVDNIKDGFKVLKGVRDSIKILKEIKPNIIFSKGGFVSVPVVIAGYILKIPIIIHESDITSGLANKIAIPFAKKVCVTFPETLNSLPSKKSVLTGSPIREEIFLGDSNKGLEICGFNSDLPVILVIGGSLGSIVINSAVRESLNILCNKYQIIHICGKNNLDNTLKNQKNYFQVEYAKNELAHFLACSSLVISRAGSNTICELVGLNKPNLLIPLSKKASRGDQLLNASSFKKQGFSQVLEEENLNKDSLIENIKSLEKDKNFYISNMKSYSSEKSIDKIIKEINKYVK